MPLSVDNAAIHHTQEAVGAIHATGAMVIFLPPYSPDFMPLEELFAQVKNWIRENDAAWQFCQDPELMVEEAFLHLTDEEVKKLYSSRRIFLISQKISFITILALLQI